MVSDHEREISVSRPFQSGTHLVKGTYAVSASSEVERIYLASHQGYGSII